MKFIAALFFSLCLLPVSSVRAQLRYDNSLSITAGAYAASGFGTNIYFGARYTYFIERGKIFVEGAAGFGSIKSAVLEKVTKAKLFDTERLVSYEFVGGFDALPNSALPYVVAGVASVNYGGQTRFAGVVGLGKHIPLTGALGSNRFGIRYDIRDQIFSQTIGGSDSFLTHNLVFTAGFQFYF